MLYSEYSSSEPCECPKCRDYQEDHEGIFLIDENSVENYLKKYQPTQLRWSISTKVNQNYLCMNFGQSKGQTYDRVLIYPTNDMEKWIFNNGIVLANQTKAKFYVGITRAKYSVGIVCRNISNFCDTDLVKKWNG